jgi:hypothetical protein
MKAVLIGAMARGRCEMIGVGGDGTAWYVSAAVAALTLVALLIVTIAGARRVLVERVDAN